VTCHVEFFNTCHSLSYSVYFSPVMEFCGSVPYSKHPKTPITVQSHLNLNHTLTPYLLPWFVLLLDLPGSLFPSGFPIKILCEFINFPVRLTFIHGRYLNQDLLLAGGFSSRLVTIRTKQWRTQEFCSGWGGIQQIQLRTENRENGDLGAVAP
jgi:hypothetical protein